MSLKLVEPSADVVAIDIINPAIIPAVARRFAEKVEEGKFGPVCKAVLVLDTESGPLCFYWGDTPNHFEAIGMLQMAVHEATRKGIEAFEDD